MKKKVLKFYNRDDVLVILTTAPTGLGHVRVTRALLEGLPKITNVEVLGLSDIRLQFLHRITSINKRLRTVMEFVQNDRIAEELFTRTYRRMLRRKTDEVEEQILDLVKRFRPKPKKVLIVATHFSLAHQLGEIKKQLGHKLDTDVSLQVVVTDDSPQSLWAVPGADNIFVPSYETKKILEDYLSGIGEKKTKIVVNPYPISNQLSEKLSDAEWKIRKKQLTPGSKEHLRVMIPISGAAVQLGYFKDLITKLSKLLWVKVIVVSRDSKHTRKFLNWCSEQREVEVVTYKMDLKVVQSYSRMYFREVIGVEVTKPSEQSFKSLHLPRMRGGSVLLFSDPVGRQEDDNVSFMRRFGLLPSAEEEEMLEKYLKNKKVNRQEVEKKASGWRGVMIPPLDGKKAAQRIFELRESGILLEMMKYKRHKGSDDVVSYKGVDDLWEYLAED